MSKVLEAIHLSKSFLTPDQKPLALLEDVSFSITEGESISIQGESGCGKSTLLYILARILMPDYGVLLWEGHDVQPWSLNTIANVRKRFMGFVFQSATLIPELTAYENIMMARRILNPIGPKDRKIVEDLIEHVGMSHRAHYLPEKLSGGERQRIAIARALANEPKLVIADEPTGNLDENTGQRIMSLLLNLCAQKKTSLILVTHHPSFAAQTQSAFHLTQGTLRLCQKSNVVSSEPVI